MSDHVVNVRRPSLHVVGGGSFPVGRILCIGRNYAAHAREMGDDGRNPPCWFTKSPTGIAAAHANGPLAVAYPPETDDLQPEVELVVGLRSGGRNIVAERAHETIYGFAVGLDMTRRDRQSEAKQARRPWSQGKDFDASAPVGMLCPLATMNGLPQGTITLTVNGKTRQSSPLTDMIWSVPELIARLSRSVTLAAGDVIFTGTPAGVAPVVPGDTLRAHISDLDAALEVHITPR